MTKSIHGISSKPSFQAFTELYSRKLADKIYEKLSNSPFGPQDFIKLLTEKNVLEDPSKIMPLEARDMYEIYLGYKRLAKFPSFQAKVRVYAEQAVRSLISDSVNRIHRLCGNAQYVSVNPNDSLELFHAELNFEKFDENLLELTFDDIPQDKQRIVYHGLKDLLSKLIAAQSELRILRNQLTSFQHDGLMSDDNHKEGILKVQNCEDCILPAINKLHPVVTLFEAKMSSLNSLMVNSIMLPRD